MSASIRYPHLDIDADGQPRIAGSRYKVLHLAGEHYHYGWSAEELLRQHPDLKPEEVYAALTYFYDHHAAIVEQLGKSSERAQQIRNNHTLSRKQLLERAKLRRTP